MGRGGGGWGLGESIGGGRGCDVGLLGANEIGVVGSSLSWGHLG